MEKIVFFDFCETLVSFQTADKFVDFCRIQKKKKSAIFLERIRIFLVWFYVFRFLSKILPENNFHKQFKLFQLKGHSIIELEELAKSFYEIDIKPNLISCIVNEMVAKKLQNYKIVIVSGGYSIYLKYFCLDYDVDLLIATEINFSSNVCNGRINGLDCLNENKITKIKREIDINKYIDSIAYSDSITDLPLFSFVKTGIVVSHKTSQHWSQNLGFKEIIWI